MPEKAGIHEAVKQAIHLRSESAEGVCITGGEGFSAGSVGIIGHGLLPVGTWQPYRHDLRSPEHSSQGGETHQVWTQSDVSYWHFADIDTDVEHVRS